jgi:uncharacterized membrane protein
MFIKIVVYSLIGSALLWHYHSVSVDNQHISFYIVLAVLFVQGNYQTYIIEKQKKQLEELEK